MVLKELNTVTSTEITTDGNYLVTWTIYDDGSANGKDSEGRYWTGFYHNQKVKGARRL